MKKSSSLLASIVVMTIGTVSHALDVSRFRATAFALKNETMQNQDIRVVLDTTDPQLREQKLTLAPQALVILGNHSNLVVKQLQVNNELYHFAFGGYDARLQRYAARVTTRIEPEFPDVINFDEEAYKDPQYPLFMEGRSVTFARGLPEGVTTKLFHMFLKNLYERAPLPLMPQLYVTRKTLSIPSVIHHIWFGSELPETYAQWREQWRETHPSWKLMLWDEKTVKKEFPKGLYNQKSYDDAKAKKNFGKMSDIVRYEVLARYGGVYVDTDMRCLQDFTVLHQMYDFYASLEPFKFSCTCCNAIIGAKPQHPVIQACMEAVKFYESREPDLSLWGIEHQFQKECAITLCTTGPKMFTQAILEHAGKNNSRDVVFPSSFFSQHPQTTSPLSFCSHEYHHAWAANLRKNELGQ